jgi:hypothetical protein
LKLVCRRLTLRLKITKSISPAHRPRGPLTPGAAANGVCGLRERSPRGASRSRRQPGRALHRRRAAPLPQLQLRAGAGLRSGARRWRRRTPWILCAATAIRSWSPGA